MFGHDKEDKKDEDVVTPTASTPPSSALLGIDDDDDQDDVASSPLQQTGPAPAVASPSDGSLPAVGDDLLNIKREALQELSPLVHQLDQSAEEKFETLMMMIQASDNKGLIPQAFAAAKQISDDKKRARALLDVVNEINYFTQNKSKEN